MGLEKPAYETEKKIKEYFGGYRCLIQDNPPTNRPSRNRDDREFIDFERDDELRFPLRTTTRQPYHPLSDNSYSTTENYRTSKSSKDTHYRDIYETSTRRNQITTYRPTPQRENDYEFENRNRSLSTNFFEESNYHRDTNSYRDTYETSTKRNQVSFSRPTGQIEDQYNDNTRDRTENSGPIRGSQSNRDRNIYDDIFEVSTTRNDYTSRRSIQQPQSNYNGNSLNNNNNRNSRTTTRTTEAIYFPTENYRSVINESTYDSDYSRVVNQNNNRPNIQTNSYSPNNRQTTSRTTQRPQQQIRTTERPLPVDIQNIRNSQRHSNQRNNITTTRRAIISYLEYNSK